MPVDYKKVEFSLHEILVQIEDAYRLMEFDHDMLAEISSCKDLIKTKRYTVAVAGEFRRGKSSLINALLGSEILPADTTPTTATINRITYSPDSKAIITYKDGGTEQIDIDELTQYVTKLTADGRARALNIKEATIFYPTVICQNYVDIIDTPGLNDENEMTRITLAALEHVDAVIVPIHACFPFSSTEKMFVCQIIESENISNIVFVVTFMDLLDEDDYVYDDFIAFIHNRIREEVIGELEARGADEALMEKAHGILNAMRLFGVSSALALQAFISNNRKLLESSRFEEFSRELLHIVTAKQMENAIGKSLGQIRLLLAQREEQNRLKMERLNGEAEALSAAREAIGTYCHGAKKCLDGLLERSYDAVDAAVKRLFAAKNAAVSLFIKALSSIRVDTHQEISNVLTETSESVRVFLNRRCIQPACEEILEVFKADINSLDDYRKAFLFGHLRVFDVETGDYTAGSDGLLSYADGKLNAAHFFWAMSPLPNVSDLSGCNPIDGVIEAVDISVNECVKRLKAIIADIRRYWFGSVESHTGEIERLIRDCFRQKSEALDRKLKAQINNYHHFENDVGHILERCEKLQAELD